MSSLIQILMKKLSEYIGVGDLKKQLDEVESFSKKRARFYAAEIILGIQFLHQLEILHQDLKLESVLVGSDEHCKIANLDCPT